MRRVNKAICSRYTVRQAKEKLSRLIREAESGKEVLLVRGDIPVAKLVSVVSNRRKRRPGRYKTSHFDSSFLL